VGVLTFAFLFKTSVGVIITPETAIAGYGGGIIAVAIGAGQ
jgi:hypothetical protein